ncbi:MAG: hypothetical protein DDT23_00438 [candidate division WS2 bacterium]|nr:hypothetical protein [Candidatus Lithacetigena glycinireducens]
MLKLLKSTSKDGILTPIILFISFLRVLIEAGAKTLKGRACGIIEASAKIIACITFFRPASTSLRMRRYSLVNWINSFINPSSLSLRRRCPLRATTSLRLRRSSSIRLGLMFIKEYYPPEHLLPGKSIYRDTSL